MPGSRVRVPLLLFRDKRPKAPPNGGAFFVVALRFALCLMVGRNTVVGATKGRNKRPGPRLSGRRACVRACIHRCLLTFGSHPLLPFGHESVKEGHALAMGDELQVLRAVVRPVPVAVHDLLTSAKRATNSCSIMRRCSTPNFPTPSALAVAVCSHASISPPVGRNRPEVFSIRNGLEWPSCSWTVRTGASTGASVLPNGVKCCSSGRREGQHPAGSRRRGR